MKISKSIGRSRNIIIDENEVSQIRNSSLYQGGVINVSYERIECENGEGIWGSRSNDNSRYSPILEAIYQKLINKPVQTTKEQPLPTTDQIIKWIGEHHKLAQNDKFHFCPCLLGKPFYPDNDCQCGG